MHTDPLLRVALFAAIASLAHCSSSEAPLAPLPGPNLVEVCRAQVGWKNTSTEPCARCRLIAGAPPCTCSPDPYAGQCQPQGQARAEETDCPPGVDQCAYACQNDCACVDQCYGAHERCRLASAKLGACVVTTCSTLCL